ncbi:MAG TPA: DUF1360 domain-containing protein [Roseiarcus sp.]|jgi:hypothetical protein|nr:DUF1360 domain-containing protein [Roseiarcus sp.]
MEQTGSAAELLMHFVLAVLATWRVTHLLANEDGPADIIFRLRRRVGDGFIGSLMDCFNCMSIWVAAPLALFVSANPVVWFVSWLALSGGACLLERLGGASAGAQEKQHMEGNDDVLR